MVSLNFSERMFSTSGAFGREENECQRKISSSSITNIFGGVEKNIIWGDKRKKAGVGLIYPEQIVATRD